jgi:Na+-transporting NADH:ubiquinone oxidoreductase subunit C
VSAKKETLGKTVGVVVAVCLVCSIIVSSAAVGLRDLQETNAAIDKQSNIVEAAGLIDVAAGDISGTFNKYIEERFINLETGEYVDEPKDGYDMYKEAKNPKFSVEVNNSNVGFKQRASVANIYLVKNDAGEVTRLVLPVHGSGLWDLMYGLLAIDADGNTVRELIYYQHKETPGLGGEIQNPSWKAKWDGKKLFDDGKVAIEVNKGDNSNDQYAVDALSGATLTSNGVENTLTYWAGENGFGPYLKNQTWKS